MEDGVIDVWPKLFCHVGEAVLNDLAGPALVGLHPLILVRGVVGVANPRGGSGADKLGNVEGPVSRVRSGDSQAANRIPGAFEESAFAQRVVTGIFFGQRWHNRSHHIVLNGVVRKCVRIVDSIAGRALAKLWLRLLRHRGSGKNSRVDERGVVKAVLRSKPEFFPKAQRRKMGVGADRTVIGNDPQDALGLLAALVSGVDWIRLGLRRIGKRGFRIAGRSRRVGRLRCGGGIGWSLLRAEFVREWTREQQEWQKKNQLLQNLLPPNNYPASRRKVPGISRAGSLPPLDSSGCPGDAFAGRKESLRLSGIARAGVNIGEQESGVLWRCGGLLAVCESPVTGFYETQSVHERRGSCHGPDCGGRSLASLRSGRFSVGKGPAYEPWKNWRGASNAGSLPLVRAAILSASPHNTQPWRCKVTDSWIELYIDPNRNVGALDPYLREEHIGMGCALENLMLAAAANGYAATVTLVPGKLAPIAADGKPKLVARVDLVPGKPEASEL
jgi:hypothetical protein